MASRKYVELSGKEIISYLQETDLASLPDELIASHLAPIQPVENLPLAQYLYRRITHKIHEHVVGNRHLLIHGPEWSQHPANRKAAAEAHAQIIRAAYGSTYALPNKDPHQNERAIVSGEAEFYFLKLEGEFVGTACLTQHSEHRAELGRSAACRPRVGNSIIQDMRILEWLLTEERSRRYHTLFTTLRTAPDRVTGETEIMRGGQAVTSQWKRLPRLTVHGTAPLYFKHDGVEQFTLAEITWTKFQERPIYVSDEGDRRFVRRWHERYSLLEPTFLDSSESMLSAKVLVKTPPVDSESFRLVHADMRFRGGQEPLAVAIAKYFKLGSPFIQVFVPITVNSIDVQRQLSDLGLHAFGYEPPSNITSGYLLFGGVRPGLSVVPTYWNEGGLDHPFWTGELASEAARIEARWLEAA